MPPAPPRRGAAFAALIRDGLAHRKLTQEQFVSDSGVSRSTLVRWLRGDAERPDPEQVRAACHTLRIDPRRAAVALGYLTDDELSASATPAMTYTDEVAEALEILSDPDLTDERRTEALNYLRYVRHQAGQERGSRAAG